MSQKKAQLFNPLNGNINVTGVVTASSFVGNGQGLTGVASTDNIQTATDATFLANVNVTGVTTAAAGFKGDLTGNVTGNATGLSGTPNITVGSVAASSGTVSGNLSIGGTLSYLDVTHIDSVGIVTAQKGIQVLANGANITGIVTVGVTTIKSGEVEVVGVVTATTVKAGTAISITDGAVSATRFHGDGSALTGIESWNQQDTWLYGAG
tara:strand:- start:1791 stop:2417 length:627 start_codon:yes stop_codon:yes gene_type:complete